MYATTILEWWHEGCWNEIGWRASDPDSTLALREHKCLMEALRPGRYRLVPLGQGGTE